MNSLKKLSIVILIFAGAYFLPATNPRLIGAFQEALVMLKDYAQKHVLLCLVPALFIAGAISIFISGDAVMRYFGAKANKILAYLIASVSGTILAVCSCTVLPLFAGIYSRGAGIGPATAFLYSGPAINVLAIILTAKILGFEMGIARAVGAVLFSIIIGLLMQVTFKDEERERDDEEEISAASGENHLLKNGLFFASMVFILIFANWADGSAIFHAIFKIKWLLVFISYGLLNFVLIKWFKVNIFYSVISLILPLSAFLLFPSQPLIAFVIGITMTTVVSLLSSDDSKMWVSSTETYLYMILPYLFIGVIISGFLLGMPGSGKGIIPSEWISNLVGGNSLRANFFASIIGAFMYFATLTEVPILQSLLGAGMGKGPALSLLLSGPALSLPSMLVLINIMGKKKTFVFVLYVVALSTIAGLIFGKIMS
ncbi:MAG: permease [bacterium]|nr:permease [bacterium]